MEWQPIETAPKDGTVILAWRFYPCVVRWNATDKDWPWEAVPIGAMYEPFEANGFSGDDAQITHWMPLPAAPSAAQSEAVTGDAPRCGPWRCFHCDEVFIDEESARAHFGEHEHYGNPGCTIDIAEYRRMQADHRKQCEEDTEWHRAFYRLGGQHSEAMRRHGDKEYARGLHDGVNLPADSPDRAAIAASRCTALRQAAEHTQQGADGVKGPEHG